MEKLNLNLQYKGARNYLHGSDFYNAILNDFFVKDSGYIRQIAFKKIARNQCILQITKPTDKEKIIGTGYWLEKNGNEIQFWLLETKKRVEARYNYDEEFIVSSAKLKEKKISSLVHNRFSIIENIIALTKKLNSSLSPDIEGSWLFGQINQLSSFPANYIKIEIERTLFVNKKFSLNEIKIDNECYGSIRFLVGES